MNSQFKNFWSDPVLSTPAKGTPTSSFMGSFPSGHALGYFAFPPDGSPSVTATTSASGWKDEGRIDVEDLRRKDEDEKEAAWVARVARDEELHRQQTALEDAEARRGEEEWVRSGGILRDSDGRRDYVRTEAIRKELKLREVERVLVEKWETYERRWKILLGPGQGGVNVKFEDIPWPVDGEALLQHFTVEKVEDFFLGGLKVRGSTVTKKERVRSSLLRWHPDKMTSLLARVPASDLESVKQGVRIVMECLQQLNSKM